MNNTKYTPGPWIAVRNSSFWEVNPLNNAGDDGIPFSVANVCSSSPRWPDGGLQEANARLIAAAPELLEVCQNMLEAVPYVSDYDVPIGLWDDLRAAIEKATGETE